ncbi:c-type cytochrome [uncultured Roseovarius sp.]|uniref:c-type cytochrome n=1 Tax=uncultured Roseovarius sp. TaxID=293344 RepID=UPI000C37B801|nr:cytochrome C [Roseovarius sp.]|tara:strand:- start:194 stop:1504 length:1311 start_codon:yes stop_codon:yes gene_type:complete
MGARAFGLWLWALVGTSPLAAQEFTTFKGHGGPVMGLCVLQTSGEVVSASFDNSVGVWQGRMPRWFEGHAAAVIAVAELGEGRLVSGGDDFALIVWDRATGQGTRREGHKGKVAALDVSPDGDWIASASWDGSIGIWPVAGGAARFLTGHDAAVSDVAFNHDGTLLYSSSADGTLREWRWQEVDAPPRELLNQGFGINRIVLGPEDAWLAYGAVDGATRVIDPASGRQIADFTLERRPVLSLVHHAETAQLAAGDGQGYIMVIDTQEWRITRDFQAMARGPVWALDFSTDGRMIYAGGLSEVVYGWPVEMLGDYDPAGETEHSFLRPPEEMENGERQFMRKCSICHALTPPPSRKAGPTLHGLFGRQAGTVPGYPYSEILDGSGIVWNDTTIDALFDLGPDHYIPGSKMPMQRITAAKDRQDMIDYLRRATATEGN